MPLADRSAASEIRLVRAEDESIGRSGDAEPERIAELRHRRVVPSDTATGRDEDPCAARREGFEWP
jgi:hypothetical protein